MRSASDLAKQMLIEALALADDADILSESLISQSNAPALLRILAVEILLKCTLLLCGKRYKRNHEYVEFWTLLPEDARSQILDATRNHTIEGANLPDIDHLLSEWTCVFRRARYYYELYPDHTLQEQKDLGKAWAERGGPIEEAKLRFYPNELCSFLGGLQSFIENRLALLDSRPEPKDARTS